MKRKVLLYLLAASALTIYVLAGNSRFMSVYLNGKNIEARPEFLKWDRYRFGDLYGLCYLKDYRVPGGENYVSPERPDSGCKQADLWIIGDSFLEQSFRGDFPASLDGTPVMDFYWFDHLDKPQRKIQIEKGKKNILLIEIAERFIRNRFGSETMANKLSETFVTSLTTTDETLSITEKRIVPATMEQNLEAVLFGYKALGEIKCVKAEFNYRIFNRTNPQVYVSETRQQLFLSSTIDTLLNTSSFKPVSDEELEQLVGNMNAVSDHYKKMGFADVVYSFIPNPASVCVPEGSEYNQLIPRIQSDKNLHVHFINIYDPMRFEPDPCELFLKSDSHWNMEGYELWKNQLNSYLKLTGGNPETEN